ncbi:phosphatase PAP2 family protein [Mesoplasma syrphidae]|uniref:Phosphatase PAP2 family protein n=1 Tax=Mesoplasma syrphidae TaxID=225999 RepID=A0A2K9BZH9_9MOLU|nr:phosphatase PAP2 family protein [Mesoplasma syrphidae]AUF83768.1 phosphatase PAP2 family protein [Mesoplasma syrphidae]
MLLRKHKQQKSKIYISLAILFIISLIVFIIATFYDQRLSAFFAKGIEYEAVKWWIGIFDEFGLFQPIVLMFIPIFVILETRVYYKKISNKKIQQRYRSLIGIWYTIFFVGWFSISIIALWLIYGKNMDMGAGPGIDPKIMGTWIYRFVGRAIALGTISIVMVGVMIYLRISFSKRNDVLSGEYWVDSIKIMVFVVALFVIVFFIKQTTGRPFYYNTIFDDGVKNELLELMQKNGIDNAHDILEKNYDRWSQANYLPWYKINGNFFTNFKFWQPWGNHLGGPNHWGDRDFPSGHTVSMFSLISLMIYFIGKNKPQISLAKYFFISFWILNLVAMNLMLVVYRFHWVTDTTFSVMLGIIVIVITNKTVGKSIRKPIVQYDNKNEIFLSSILVKFKNAKAQVYIVKYGKKHLVKQFRPRLNSRRGAPRVIMKKIIKYAETKYQLSYDKVEFVYFNETFENHEYKAWISEFKEITFI